MAVTAEGCVGVGADDDVASGAGEHEPLAPSSPAQSDSGASPHEEGSSVSDAQEYQQAPRDEELGGMLGSAAAAPSQQPSKCMRYGIATGVLGALGAVLLVAVVAPYPTGSSPGAPATGALAASTAHSTYRGSPGCSWSDLQDDFGDIWHFGCTFRNAADTRARFRVVYNSANNDDLHITVGWTEKPECSDRSNPHTALSSSDGNHDPMYGHSGWDPVHIQEWDPPENNLRHEYTATLANDDFRQNNACISFWCRNSWENCQVEIREMSVVADPM